MEIKAVEMTRKIREQIHRETEGMSWPELKAYIDKRSRAFRAQLEKDRQEDARAAQASKRRAGAVEDAPAP